MVRVVTVGGGPAQEELRRFLSREGMEVRALEGAAELDGMAAAWPADIVVIDAERTGASGFSLAAKLRLTTRAGVVMLVGRGRTRDRLSALSLGVDRCLTKPFDPREAVLHLHNLHRRLAHAASPGVAAAMAPDGAPAGGWICDAAHWTLTVPGGQVVSLTLAEHQLLLCLIRRCGQVVARQDLLEALGRRNLKVASRNLDMIVSRLRRKVERTCREALPLRAVRGVGYVFAGEGSVAEA